MENLHLSDNKRYLMKGSEPFFWLADTGWLIFGNISEEEAYNYLKNRADKGFNVIQAVLVYSTKELESVNKMYWGGADRINDEEYWQHVERIIKMADKLGLYMALLPSWGSLLKNNLITSENVLVYGRFLAERLEKYSNIIWVLGGDIKADNYVEIYRKLGRYFKEKMPDKLITFHPFGRCASSMWFADDSWLDFNMFQSGHRRYDQCNLGAWDDTDNPSYYGEDNWKYVKNDYLASNKPTLDAEPSYEWILQGLHDNTQPYWKAKQVRRYAYWSVFQGACGHTYGDNAVMQFYKEGCNGVNYGVVCEWEEALHHEGSGQMQYLKKLMESVDFINGKASDSLVVGGQREKHARIAVFAGQNFVFAYDYLGEEFELDTSDYKGRDMWWMSPVTGAMSYIGRCKNVFTAEKFKRIEEDNTDRVLVIK